MTRIIRFLLCVLSFAWAAAACGWDLSTMPIGGMEIGEDTGLSRAALEGELDRIAAAHAGEPFAVTRAKWISMVFTRVRLAMNKGDAFAHWHPDSDILVKRFRKRMDDFAASSTERRHCGKWVDSTHGAWMGRLDTSHTCPDWESILALGPKGISERAKARLAQGVTKDEQVFLAGVVEVYEAMRALCRRWADFAQAQQSPACAAALRAIAERPPQTLREALQLALLYDRCQETEGECVRSQGLFDRLFLDHYRRDVSSGRETRDSAKKLVAEWFTCFYVQNHPNCKNIAIGGYDAEGRAVWNDLTELVIDLHQELNRPNPKLTFRLGAKTPAWQLKKVARCLASGRTSVVFANEEKLAETFARQGVAAKDCSQSVLIGCYEPAIQGREIIASMATEVNLVKPLETALNGGRDFSGAPTGLVCPFPATVAAFEREYCRQLKHALASAMAATVECERNWGRLNPSPLMSGACRDAVASAKDCGCGGMKYNQSGVVFIGLATAVDSIAAVRYLVDEAKAIGLADLATLLKHDWKGREELRLMAVRRAPKWGNGDMRADGIGRTIFEFVAAAVQGVPNGHGGTFQTGLWSIDRDLAFAPLTGATADGRRSGDPISRNNSATAGCGIGGPTALLNSLLQLDQSKAANGLIADIILPVGGAGGEKGAEIVAGALRAYFNRGGQCAHFNCFDLDTLLAARAHPERYPDLQVRVCGWNVRWNDLSRAEQDHFIKTVAAQSGQN